MATCDPATVMADGKCFQCLGPREMDAARLQLICDLKGQLESMATVINNLITAINDLQAGPTHEDLVYAATTVLNFDGADYQTVALTGDIDFASSLNRPAAGYAKAIAVIIEADGSDRTLTFNANWTFMGTAPADIAANKVGVLSLTATGPAEADVVCAYYVED